MQYSDADADAYDNVVGSHADAEAAVYNMLQIILMYNTRLWTTRLHGCTHHVDTTVYAALDRAAQAHPDGTLAWPSTRAWTRLDAPNAAQYIDEVATVLY